MDDLLKKLETLLDKADKDLKSLKKENEQLKEEVESVWGLLDELKASDVENWTHLVKKIEEDAILKTLMTTKKKADC